MRKMPFFGPFMMKIEKVLIGVLFLIISGSASPSTADEYVLNAQNQPDGSVVVTYDLYADPGLTEIYANRQFFSYFENLTEFIRSTEKGYPEVLSKQVTLSVQPYLNYTVRIVESEFDTYDLSSPYLVGRGKINRSQNPKLIPYVIDAKSRGLEKYPMNRIELEAPFFIRNVSGFSFRFNVTEFNTLNDTVKLYTHLKFEIVPDRNSVKKNSAVLKKNSAVQNHQVVPGLYNILPYLFLNYEGDTTVKTYRRAYSTNSSAEILVIYTARDASAIQPYIQHKQSMGFTVHAQQVAAGTNVKNIIQNAYNQNQNIFFVQLVGDWEDIKSDLGTGQNAPMDPMLGRVSGNDNYPDLAVGRFSASSASEVTIQVNKTITYEQNSVQPYWDNALGIGSGEGPGDDGELDYAHIDVIKEYKLLPNQYSNVGEIYSSGSTSQVANFINSGTHLINYCGHGSPSGWGTTGFSSSNVNGLTNGDKLPIIFAVACVNGQFHTGTCFAEAWLRKSNGGAVATVMSTINQPWTPPMRGQDYMNDLITGGYNYGSNPGTGTSTTSGKYTFGEIILNAFSLMYAESSSNDDLETISTWTIFGDSSLLVVDDGQSPPSKTNYILTVNSGSGSGSYAAGTTVSISASAAPSGQVFNRWVVDSGNVSIDDIYATTTTLTMGLSAATVTATYTGNGTNCYKGPVTLNLTTDDLGSETSWTLKNENGQIVASMSDYNSNSSYTGKYIVGPGKYIFTIEDDYGDGICCSQGNGSYTLMDANGTTIVTGGDFGTSESTAFCIEGTINATTYYLTVYNGNGGGKYSAGDTVTIQANTPSPGKVFDHWILSGSASFADASSETTILTMGNGTSTVTAAYKNAPILYYTLTVVNGSGNGSYATGKTVGITADPAPNDQVFDGWVMNTCDSKISNANASTAFLTIGTGNCTVTATYKEKPATYCNLTVKNGSGGGTYTTGMTVEITADPAPSGQTFDSWVMSACDSQISSTTASNAFLTAGTGSCTVTATYTGDGNVVVNDKTYFLTIFNGSGGGSYTAGTVVTIAANPAQSGKVFDHWIVSGSASVTDINAATTTLTMGASAATVTATYKNAPATYCDLTVINGSGSGTYTTGKTIGITADPAPNGQSFSGWVMSACDSQISSTTTSNALLTAGTGSCKVTATYSEGGNVVVDGKAYPLTIFNGSGGGSYTAGTVVTITANPAQSGKVFDHWIVSGSASVSDINAATTTLTMGSSTSTITATYKTPPVVYYTLTVVNGSGSGSYITGKTVNIAADPAPNGQIFDSWVMSVCDSQINNANVSDAILTIGTGDCTVTATYKDKPITFCNVTVINGKGSGTYTTGMTIGITADPAPDGQVFNGWSMSTCDSHITDANASTAFLKTGTGNCTITATYKASGDVELVVNNGSGGGWYKPNTYVTVAADPAPDGKVFDRWSVSQGSLSAIADSLSPNTQVYMTQKLIINALYKVNPTYHLSISNGIGSGYYTAGTVVSIIANTAQPGKVFDYWNINSGNPDIDDPNASSAKLTMGSSAATVTAIYKNQSYPLTVNNGSGDGSYIMGTIVTITAGSAPVGKEFDCWVVNAGDITIKDANASTTTLTMGPSAVMVTATYKNAFYPLTVKYGIGSGSYIAGTEVTISANAALPGQEFDHWEVTAGNAQIENVHVLSTTLTTGTSAATVTAIYKGTTYPLTVNNGSGDGNYAPDTQVSISADSADTGKIFDSWVVEEGSPQIADVNNPTTALTTRSSASTVTATYKDKSYALTVNNGNGDGSYTMGTTVTISALPALTGQEFDHWVVDEGNAQIEDVNNPTTTLTMNTSDATVTATYKNLSYTLTVNNGSGSGSYTMGTVATIIADPAQPDQEFFRWVVTAGNAQLGDANATTTTLTMAAADATVTATYQSIGTLSVAPETDPGVLVAKMFGVDTGTLPSSVSNLTYTGGSGGQISAGTFAGAPNIFGFETGVILSSGKASSAEGGSAGHNSSILDLGGHPVSCDLGVDSEYGTDATILEFDLQASGGLSFDFVFASEEYYYYYNHLADPAVGDASSNDIFEVYVDGVKKYSIDFNSAKQNFIDNITDPELYGVEYDGFSNTITAQIGNLGGGKHHIKFVIADVTDAGTDTAVFIKAGSFPNGN